jgi:hypothetical protein
MFLSYRRPFRVIALAMAALVRRGEAAVLAMQGDARASRNRSNRAWCRAIVVPPQVMSAGTRELLSDQYEIRSNGYCL